MAQDNIVKQSYIVAAHAHAARLGLTPESSYVHVNGWLESGARRDSNGNMLPPGCEVKSVTVEIESYSCEFLGVNADGDFVVRHPYRDTVHVLVPYTLISEEGGGFASFVLNDEYDAELDLKNQEVIVGCQRIEIDRVRDLLAWIEEQQSTVTYKLPEKIVATYQPPKAAKKVAKKKAKKAAKKATKRTRRK